MAIGSALKVLVTRTDRLGDLVLSLPAMAMLKKAQPTWDVQVMVAPGTVPIVENERSLSKIWTWREDQPLAETMRLVGELRKETFDAVVMFYYDTSLARMLRKVGITRRYGPLSKWTSWILLNRGVRQNRSAGGQHEADFNLELSRCVLDDESGTPYSGRDVGPQLHLSQVQQRAVSEFREHYHCLDERVVFIHPGSGGSALNWEPEHFASVANELAALSGCRVFVTGAGRDSEIVSTVGQNLASEVTVLLNEYVLRDFLPVLAAGDLFIGPSTGPLHMASALGVPTLGIFPPAPTMHPDRWGPLRADDLVPSNLVPDLICPARRTCHGARCEFYNCLDTISVASVLQHARELLTIDRTTRYSPVEV